MIYLPNIPYYINILIRLNNTSIYIDAIPILWENTMILPYIKTKKKSVTKSMKT